MNKKRILIVSFFTAIMLLVSFTVAGFDPSRSVREREVEDDSKLEKYPEIADFIDISDLELSSKEIAELQEQVADLRLLSTAIDEYTGGDVSFDDIPVIIDGETLMLIPISGNDFFLPQDDGLGWSFLALIERALNVVTRVFWSL